MALAVAVLTLTIMGRAAPARADSAPAPADLGARQTAQARLVEGVDLLRKEQFAAAMAKFDQAYALVPSPNIHYNRGLAYVGLGRPAEALEAFDAFLADADHAPPGTREKAERQRLALRTHVATLVVTTDLAGAQVTLDGRPRGMTPLTRTLYLDPGLHEVSARNNATGASASEKIAAAPEQKLSVALRLGAADARATSVGVRDPVRSVRDPDARDAPASERGVRDSDVPSAARLWALSAATVGVGLLGAGATFGLLAQHEANGLSNDALSIQTIGMRKEFDQSKETNGLRYQTIEWICLATGAAALATGAVLFTVGRRTERRASMAISGAPSITHTFTGAEVRLSF